ncbi:MAG: glutamine--tRNA ligase/YqeY domain fusion protein [Lachnospiraceae bacterium]|nr:glutamine--tRNA ligase/YqeY domain fusion protein [Lachnospiraceae bacterium]
MKEDKRVDNEKITGNESSGTEEGAEKTSRNFIEMEIDKDLAEGKYTHVVTRFPPEPNGFLHIGHAKSILLNYHIAKEYGGQFNLRFDDTNPTKEKDEYVEAIKKDVEWLGVKFNGPYFASNYFDRMYEAALNLIKAGKAYVSDLSAEEIREYRGGWNDVGKDDPNRNRSVEENLDLFTRMKNGEFADGEKVLRAKIDMKAANINMRDPILYRIAHLTHQNTGDKWCIYPMYDFAHPLEDAFEGVTHSLCTLEFEDHRPLYNWVVQNVGMFENPPRQIEFAKLYLTNVVTGKRYIKKLVENGTVDGWDDPRLVTIAALRRRGYTPESIQKFVELGGIAKANSSTDYAMLEYCIRDDLKAKAPRMYAVLDPVKVVIDNYPEGKTEEFEVPNNPENEALGTRKVTFSRELYIERSDFMEVPPKKYFRMFPGNEVRLMQAYFVKCVSCEKDADGRVTLIHVTYDPASRGGNSPDGRKVKGTIHWVNAADAKQVEVRLYNNLIDEEKGVYNEEDGSMNINPDSMEICQAYVEPALAEAKAYDRFQFVRNGFFSADPKLSQPGQPVFGRIVSLKSSFKLPAAH